MLNLNNIPIKRKLLLISLVTKCTALLLASVCFVIYEQITFRKSMIQDLSVAAGMVGSNSAAALSFNDPTSAQDTLKFLSAEPGIVAACIYDAQGKLFATYLRGGNKGNAFTFPGAQTDTEYFGNDELNLFRRIHLAGETIGIVFLQSDLQEMQARLRRYVLIVCSVMFVSVLAALVLSARLQRYISRPILDLAATANAVSIEKNYAIRATKQGEDELGLLIDGFNHMLSQIQEQDCALQQARDHLERRVQERTEELQQEILERRRTELELTLERELMDSLMESIPDMIFFKDSAGRLIKTNQAHADLFHLASASEMIGKTDFDFHPAESARSYFEEEQQIIKTGQALIGHVQKNERPDGRTNWFLVTKMPLRDKGGKIIGTFGTSKDITALKEAEQALRDSEDRFRRLAEATSEVFWILDPKKFEILYVSPAFEEVWGRSCESLYQNAETFLEAMHPDDQSRERANLERQESGEATDTEYRVIRPDGSIRWVWDRGYPIRDAAGQVYLVTGIAQDITERKEAEARLTETHQQLLETSRQAGMAEVATAVLHNVGNVLNSVNVSASLMTDAIRKSKLPGLAKAVGLMEEQSTHLGDFLMHDPKGKQLPDYLKKLAEHLGTEQAGMLQELGSLSKNIEHIKDIVSMQQAYARVSGVAESIAPADLVDDALRMNAGALTRHDVQVIREYSELPKILVEKHKVLQILVNLISNAKYAMDEQNPGVKQLVMRMGMNGNGHFKIAVIDNGIGISAESLTRIFAHGFTTKKTGHGFGLHSSALAAKEMGGRLQVHSEGVGKGATFTLELPLKVEEEAHG
jgi:PAS domain S-box-containing protein